MVACEQRPIEVVPEEHHIFWEPFGPQGYPNYYTSLEGTSMSNIYGTAIRKLIHFDGDQWTEIDAPGTLGLNDLWIASENEIYIISGRSLLLYDGAVWTTVGEYDKRYYFKGIWASSADDIHIAAGNKIVHFDGSAWSTDSLAAHTGDLDLISIWGTNSSDIFAVGQVMNSNEVIYHNNGSGWEMMYFGNFGQLDIIWGSASNDIYAGGPWRILHYDGETWSEVLLPLNVVHFTEIWGTGRNDVWVFYGGDPYALPSRPNGMMHFDGVDWENVESSTNMALLAAWGASPDTIIAVGAASKIVQYSGSKWSSVSGGRLWYPVCIWGFDENDIFIGDTKAIYRYSDGELVEFSTVSGLLRTSDLWGSSPSFLVSVGLGGRIFVYNGAEWTRASLTATSHFTSVSGVSEDVAWAVGQDGMCFFYNGIEWVQLFEQAGTTFRDVWPASKNFAFVVGDAGTVVRFDESGPTFFDAGITDNLYTVWGTSPSDVFAAGENGVIIHFDGNEWKRMAVPIAKSNEQIYFTYEFVSIVGKDHRNVIALDVFGHILFYNGTVWNVETIHEPITVSDVWMSPEGRLFAPGFEGMLVATPEW